MAMKQSFNDHKQGCSWPLGVTNSKAFTDEVRSPRLLRTRCKRIVQQLKRHQTPLFIVGQTRKCRKTTLTDLCNPRAVLYYRTISYDKTQTFSAGGSKFCFHLFRLLPPQGKCRWIGRCRRRVEVWKQSRCKFMFQQHALSFKKDVVQRHKI